MHQFRVIGRPGAGRRKPVDREPDDPRESSVAELRPRQARRVLLELLDTHPELVDEAAQLARTALAELPFAAVAEDVETALRTASVDGFRGRAGRSVAGLYTAPTDAAWEVLYETVEPFLAELQQCLDLEQNAEALVWCQGIIAGLYRLHGERTGVLGWARDFPAQMAAAAVELWRPSSDGAHGLSAEFIARHAPAWQSLAMVLP